MKNDFIKNTNSIEDCIQERHIISVYSLIYDLIYGGLIAKPQELLALIDEIEYEKIKIITNRKRLLIKELEEYSKNNKIDSENRKMLDKSPSLRHFIANGYHDVNLIKIYPESGGLVFRFLGDYMGMPFIHGVYADKTELVFKNSVFIEEEYDKLKAQISNQLIISRYRVILADKQIKSALLFFNPKNKSFEEISVNATDIAIRKI